MCEYKKCGLTFDTDGQINGIYCANKLAAGGLMLDVTPMMHGQHAVGIISCEKGEYYPEGKPTEFDPEVLKLIQAPIVVPYAYKIKFVMRENGEEMDVYTMDKTAEMLQQAFKEYE